jgi:hypothetical protein
MLMNVRFEAFRSVIIKSTILWDLMPYILVAVLHRFGGSCPLQLQNQRVSQARRVKFGNDLSSGLLGLLFAHEDGSSTFLRNVCKLHQTTRCHISEHNALRARECLVKLMV